MSNSKDATASSTSITGGAWMALVAALLGWMFDGFEMGLFPLTGRPALQDLLSGTITDPAKVVEFTNQWFGVIMAVFLVGAATGGVFFGWLGDKLGRVRALSLSILTYAIFTGLCGFATEAWHIAVLRFIASLGMGGEWALGVALVIEIWPDRSRAMLAGLIGAASNVGFFLVPVIAISLTSLEPAVISFLQAIQLPESTITSLTANQMWRLLMIVGAAPALLVFFIRIFVPESEKWHAEKESGATSNWATIDLMGVLIGCVGAISVIVVWSPIMHLSEVLSSQMTLGIIRGLVTPVGLLMALLGYMYPVRRYLWRADQSGSLRSMGSKQVLKRMLFGASLTGIALLGTWGTVQWIPYWVGAFEGVSEIPHAKSYAQMASAIGAIVGTMIAALTGGWIGRRPTYALLCLVSICCVLMLFQSFNSFSMIFLVFVALAGGSTAAFYGFFPLYLPELFPTSVRSTAQGFAFNFGRILAAIGGLQVATLTSLFDGNFAQAASALSLIYVFGMLIIWFGPETKNLPLPE